MVVLLRVGWGETDVLASSQSGEYWQSRMEMHVHQWFPWVGLATEDFEFCAIGVILGREFAFPMAVWVAERREAGVVLPG
jgi:hypothetical protein